MLLLTSLSLILGAKLIKIFTTAKILLAKQALLPAASEKFFKFSIVICLNCIWKMLIWGHFCNIMKLWLNNYLGHFLIIEKTFVFLFIESAIKPTPLLLANVQMLQRTKCNQSNWWWTECFYEPESPVIILKSGQLKLPICSIHQSYGWTHIHSGSDKFQAHGRAWVFQKAYRRLHNYE